MPQIKTRSRQHGDALLGARIYERRLAVAPLGITLQFGEYGFQNFMALEFAAPDIGIDIFFLGGAVGSALVSPLLLINWRCIAAAGALIASLAAVFFPGKMQ